MKLKNVLRNLILATVFSVGFGITTYASIIVYAGPQGHGLQSEWTYGENYPIDSWGLSAPVDSWQEWPDATSYDWDITVDTDYGTGTFSVGTTTGAVGIEVILW